MSRATELAVKCGATLHTATAWLMSEEELEAFYHAARAGGVEGGGRQLLAFRRGDLRADGVHLRHHRGVAQVKTLWLNRTLTVCAGCYALFLSEQAFHRELRRLEVPVADWPSFSKEGADAVVYYFKATQSRRELALVCLNVGKAAEKEPIEVAGLLIHEAVHIWQWHARLIGSFNDHGDEEEAYAIQQIAQQLMWSYNEQTKEARKC